MPKMQFLLQNILHMGKEVWDLAQDVMASVKDRFGVSLEPEVNQVGLQD